MNENKSVPTKSLIVQDREFFMHAASDVAQMNLPNGEKFYFKCQEDLDNAGLGRSKMNIGDIEFQNIASEEYRTYTFADNCVTITSPVWLNVSKSGGHRLIDIEGISHYIPSGWYHLCWMSKEGMPKFVK